MTARTTTALLLGATLIASSATLGCATADPYGRPVVTQNEALGAAAGGLAGAAIAHKAGSRSKRTENAILGGLGGALLGGWLGGQVDKPRHEDRRPYYNGRY
jgi:uncharacterized protein YcfJ